MPTERHGLTVRGVDFHVEYPYDAPPGDVYSMLTDSEFLRARLAATGALDYEVIECTPMPDGGFRVVTSRTVQTDIPGFAKKVFKPTNSLQQVEHWNGGSQGSPAAATWTIEAKGTPVKTSGTVGLEASGTGTVQHIDGTIKVSVPLLGGRLERFVFDNAKKTLELEHEFGQQWLAEHA